MNLTVSVYPSVILKTKKKEFACELKFHWVLFWLKKW